MELEFEPSLMDLLPRNVLERIFGLLPFDMRVVCARSICISWGALYGLPSLWSSLRLPKYAVVLPYLPHGCVSEVVISALKVEGRKDAADSCRLLSRYGQHAIKSITLEGHGIDSSIMEFLARIVTPSLTTLNFYHVGLSFERLHQKRITTSNSINSSASTAASNSSLLVFARAENVTSLRITRQSFRRATIPPAFLQLFPAGKLSVLRLDNLGAHQVPDLGRCCTGLVNLWLDGLVEVGYWAELKEREMMDANSLGASGGANISGNSRSEDGTSASKDPLFPSYPMPRLTRLSCTNLERGSAAIPEDGNGLTMRGVMSEDDAIVSKFMTAVLSHCPALEQLVFSCDGYFMDLWPCAEFWGNIRQLWLDRVIITSDFVRSLEAGVIQLREHHYLTYGAWPNHVLQIRLGSGCMIEDVDLVRQVFGNECFSI